MRYLFVGGPGRSGTSFVADRLGRHPSVTTLKDIELKIFCEKNGLVDLRHALVETYSPNRAIVAFDQFRRLADALIEGRHGQQALMLVVPAAEWHAVFDAFVASLSEDDQPVAQTAESYMAAARRLLSAIAGLTAKSAGQAPDSEDVIFLEKTPHNLLRIDFLADLSPGATFLHVMRDPRAIAWSLLAMPWGPGTLPAAARWVDGYCRAWIDAEREADALGVSLLRLHIEDVAAAPGPAANWLTDALDLAPRPDLFAGVNPEVLSRGVASAEADARALLDRRLGGWTAHFGYAAEEVGCRLAPAFPAPEPAEAAGSKRQPA